MDNNSISKPRLKIRDFKGVIISFGIGVVIGVLLWEPLGSSPAWEKNHGLGESSFLRPRREGTAVELYAEDIWRNGRRTLKTAFNPSACMARYFDKSLVRWSEVECVAEDESGRRWQYTTRYSDNLTIAFFMPFFVDVGPTRELKITHPNVTQQEAAK